MLAIEDLSAWRHFRTLEKPKRRPGCPRKNRELNQLYGYPVEVISEWCAVSRSTAHGYKTGRLRPSKPTQKLFRLYRDRVVLTIEWEGWVIKKDCIVDPDNNETARKALHNLSFMVQYFKELAGRSGDEEVKKLWGFLRAP